MFILATLIQYKPKLFYKDDKSYSYLVMGGKLFFNYFLIFLNVIFPTLLQFPVVHLLTLVVSFYPLLTEEIA